MTLLQAATVTPAAEAQASADSAQQAAASRIVAANIGREDRNDTVVKPIAAMPVVTAPQGGNALRHYDSPLHNGLSMTLLVLVAFFVLSSYREGKKFFTSLPHNMFSIKGGDDLYRDHTLKNTRVVVAMAAMTSLMEAIMLFYSMYLYHPSLVQGMQPQVGLYVLALAVCCGVFYVLQLLLFRLLGFVFADTESTEMWVSAFHATQAALGIALFPVVCVTLAFPQHIHIATQAAIFFYITARLVFVCKGFRIFFNNLSLCVYFILYLCAVEIVPPVLALGGMVLMCNVLQA